MAERLRKAIELVEFQLDSQLDSQLDGQQVIHRTCSIGYACYPFDVHSPEAVTMEQTIDIADWCLYSVKNNGRNGWAGLELNQPLDSDIEKFMRNIDDYIQRKKATLVRN